MAIPSFTNAQAPPKDNNPANPANWEKVASITGNVSYVSYTWPSLVPITGSWQLDVPQNPVIAGIYSWGFNKGTWDLSGTNNFRWKWVGIGASPVNVRVLNSGSSSGLFSGTHSFINTLTGVDNIEEVFDSAGTEGKYGGGYKTVSADTLFQIGFTQKAELTHEAVGHTNSTASFGYIASSSLAELSTALRYSDTTFHKAGEFGNKAPDIGSSYSDWVMNACIPGDIFSTTIILGNGILGPWNTSVCTFKYTSDDSLAGQLSTESLTSKTLQYDFTRAQWLSLADSPEDRTVTVEVTDPSASDSPKRIAKMTIRLHNPFENWRLCRNGDGSPLETCYWKDPEFKEYTPATKTTTFYGDEDGITFKYRHSYPVIQHIQDSITGNPLIKALQDFVQIKWVPIALKAGITAVSALEAEQWQPPVSATFDVKWNDSHSTFSPPKDESKKHLYMMGASVSLQYKHNDWVCDGYDNNGFVGFQYGATDKRIPGQFVYGIFTIGAAGGGDEGGGITPIGG